MIDQPTEIWVLLRLDEGETIYRVEAARETKKEAEHLRRLFSEEEPEKQWRVRPFVPAPSNNSTEKP